MLGSRLRLWKALVEHLLATYHAQEDFKFCYGKKYGWALTFRTKGNLLTALYPSRDGFVVQIILNRLALKEAEALTLGDAALQAIARAKPYPEGKWLFIPVQKEHEVRDVQCLMALKQGTLAGKKAAGAKG